MTNAEWVEAVAREHYARILRIAYRRARTHRIPNPDSWAEDMTQTVFLVLSQQAAEKDLRRHENIAAWLSDVLFHVIGNDWQKRGGREIPTAHVEALRHAPSAALVIEDPFPPGLTEAERSLLYRCHCLKIPRREIAASLGITLGACQMRLERAEAHFRMLLKKETETPAEIDGTRQETERIIQEGGVKHV